ncbi:zinc ion binding [Ascochyta rabiei]|uniref:RBR-type E3 ubiquitin transferase n=1 Tax=Didymella rabiei TaxID=5454 RepID=A0A163I7S4_DIDRA|nr:zinc ion binding [Ascochyta rabiei]
MDFTSMDPQTAKVAIQLQLADLADLLDSLYNDNEVPEGDERASIEMIQRDLTHQLSLLEGQVLVIKILKDEYNERVAFNKLLDDERQAVSDHQLAMSLAGIPVGPADAAFSANYEAQLREAEDNDQDEQWEMAKDLYASAFGAADEDSIQHAPEGGPIQPVVANRPLLRGVRTAPSKQTKGDTNSKILGSDAFTKCNACMEIVPSKNVLRLQCAPELHSYCRTCLLDLFTSAIENPTLFPPRCCRVVIPLDTCRTMLPREMVKKFDLKVDELATPNPTYCANAGCSKFIRPKDITNGIGVCVFCKHKTCAQCKSQEHTGLCPSDPHVQLLMDAAKRSKWQQCTRCNNMVELAHGCFHMTYVPTNKK